MKKKSSKTIGLTFWLVFNVGQTLFAATSIDTRSSAFTTAVKYGLSYTLLTSGELNYLPDNSEASKITQKVHNKIGERVAVNVFGKKLEEGIRVSVEFPDFEVGRFKFILNFLQTARGYTFLGYENDFLGYQFDMKTTGVELELPESPRTIVTNEFVLNQADIKTIKSWFEGFLEDGFPKFKGQRNHFFIAPFSKSYNANFRVYWVEGKQVIEFDRLWMRDHPGIVKWHVRMSFQEPSIALPQRGSEIYVLHSTSLELATCVRDGLLISTGP